MSVSISLKPTSPVVGFLPSNLTGGAEREDLLSTLSSKLVLAHNTPGSVLGDMDLEPSPSLSSPPALSAAFLKNVASNGVPGVGVLLCKTGLDVGETARSKIESGEAGRSGVARGKSAKCGSGGVRKGLYGDSGEVVEMGECGKRGESSVLIACGEGVGDGKHDDA